MIRKIIKIDEEKCNGCGACAHACHEGAIDIIDGKAKLTRENYCDGLGDCLPQCPTGAITFEEREAPTYDEAAVLMSKQLKANTGEPLSHTTGCPGAKVQDLRSNITETTAGQSASGEMKAVSCLAQWPCQIKLVPVSAPYFAGADLLIAADCTAYAYANFHTDFMKGRITLIGCPKLDAVDYSEKLAEILKYNNIKSVTLLRMEVPCCGGLEIAAKKALENSQKQMPLQVFTVSFDGRLLIN